MALNFPNSPSLNDIYEANGTKWQWDGSSWVRIVSAGNQGFQGVQGAVGAQGAQGATGPVAGSANQVVYKDSGNSPAGSSNFTFDGSNVGIGTTNTQAKLSIVPPTAISTSSVPYGISLIETTAKTYPTTSDFRAYAGHYTQLEFGTSQTVDPTTPGGFNFVYGDLRQYYKSAGTTSDIERLYFNGFTQLFSWNDANTCKQYEGFNDQFNYSGINANGRTSSFLGARDLFLAPPDGGTQTIANATGSNGITFFLAGISTVNVTDTYNLTPNLRFLNIDAGTKTVNITNHTFFGTNSLWGTDGAAVTYNATITNLYGLRLTAPLSSTGLTITNNWGIRQEWSSAKNWFAGASNQFPNITTTASGANAFLDSGDSNRLYRSTSSVAYKRDIETLDSSCADQILNLRPVWYRSRCENDCPDWSWYGLIAEEVAEIDPRFVHYGYQEDAYELVDVTETVQLDSNDPRFEEGIKTEEVTRQVRQLKADAQQVPNGVAYERLVVPLLDIIKRQKSQLESFEARLSALEAS